MIRVGKKWEPGAQYIGRGSPLGNPFVMREKSAAERDRVCEEYARWFAAKVADQDPAVMTELRRLYRVYQQRGLLVLGCFCAPQRCHGDTIKQFLESQQ